MFKSIMNKNKLFNIINNSLISLPTPQNISIWWNFGSMLGICLMIQIISGLFLSMHYCPNINNAFISVMNINQNIKYGWMIRNIHMNGASFYFICMYIHIARNIYYFSFKKFQTWNMGVTILLLSMATAFVGYVLPWGQMSFWGATVITNLLSTIPYLGDSITQWIWGGFSINNPTLNRFYTFHFILPFIILSLVTLHLMFLHQSGSTNPLGLNSNLAKIPFNIYFSLKDIIGFKILFMLLFIVILQYPNSLSDPDNFFPANPMITPIHIQPEWYFLFAYAILRAIPNKLGGVIALLMSIMILYIMPLFNSMMLTNKFYPINQMLFWMFISSTIILTWSGMKSIEYPFIQISQIYSILYFSYFILTPLTLNLWDSFIFKKLTI
nr:cytochrome b [Diodontus medius]